MSIRPPKEDDAPKGTELASYYKLAQNLATQMNGSSLQLLSVARVMVQLPATTRMGQSRTFGPYAPGGADPLTYRLVISKLGDAVFAYTLSARGPSVGMTESEYLTVLEGAVTQGERIGSGKGRMTVYFDNRRKLSPPSYELE